MVSLRRHFVPNPVSSSEVRFALQSKSPLFLHTRYDGLGRRISREAHNSNILVLSQDYLYDGQQVVETVGSTYGNNNFHYQYIWSPLYVDSPILRDSCDSNGNPVLTSRLYYLTDATHNVTTLVGYNNSSQTWVVKERCSYDAYGSPQFYEPNWWGSEGDYLSNDRLFGGKERDTFTGLYYFASRWYNPSTGGFISRDGLSNGDANLYRYCGNNPATFNDPTGMSGGSGGAGVLSDGSGGAWDPLLRAAATVSLEFAKLYLGPLGNLVGVSASGLLAGAGVLGAAAAAAQPQPPTLAIKDAQKWVREGYEITYFPVRVQPVPNKPGVWQATEVAPPERVNQNWTGRQYELREKPAMNPPFAGRIFETSLVGAGGKLIPQDEEVIGAFFPAGFPGYIGMTRPRREKQPIPRPPTGGQAPGWLPQPPTAQ
jgi:RHS repeat-associated protein